MFAEEKADSTCFRVCPRHISRWPIRIIIGWAVRRRRSNRACLRSKIQRAFMIVPSRFLTNDAVFGGRGRQLHLRSR